MTDTVSLVVKGVWRGEHMSASAVKNATKRSATSGSSARETADACPRLRIRIRENFILGPGKIDLLDAIAQAGSISAAGRAMGMSYKRAWQLVDSLNTMFERPVVVAEIGGAKGGGAVLTEFGQKIVLAYRRAEERSAKIIEDEFERINVRVLP